MLYSLLHRFVINKFYLRIVLGALSLGLISVTLTDVIQRHVSLVSLALWIGSIILSWIAISKWPLQSTSLTIQKKEFFMLLICVLTGGALLLHFQGYPAHYHQDEFITAYTSWTLPPVQYIDWFAAYPEIWVSQFPVLFHALQKPWFLLMGPTLTSLRASTLPYALSIIILLYILARTVTSKRTAIITCTIFICLTPHAYLESTGLHFVSSVFFYIAAVTSWIMFFHTKKDAWALGSGVWGACAYLTYTSSYVTLPVLILSGLGTWLATRDARVITGILKMCTMWVIVMAPFLTYAFSVNNFFLQRIDQVNIFWGSWSDTAKANTSPVIAVANQTTTALRSLILPNIGGLGGYNFGKLALLDIFSALLLCIGIIVSIRKLFFEKNIHHLTIGVAFLVPFVSGFILTTHPPPFHRISLTYPFMAWYMTLGLLSLLARVKNRHLYTSLLLVLLTIILVTNISRTRSMIIADSEIYPQNSRIIANHIAHTVPKGTTVYIGAYESFYLSQELLFRLQNDYVLVTMPTEELLPLYEGGLLVLLSPTEETESELAHRFPNGKLLHTLDGVNLRDIAVFTSQ